MSKFIFPRRNNYQVRNPVLEEETFNESLLGAINTNKVHLALNRMKRRCHQASLTYKIKGLNAFYKSNTTQKNWLEMLIEQFNENQQINNSKHISIMCKFNKFIGTVTNYFNNMYTITVDGKSIHMSFEVMHKFPAFPASMMEEGHLKTGVSITMVKKDERTYYPDHETYGIKNQDPKLNVDGSYLLKDAKPYKMTNNLTELMTKVNAILPSLPENQRMETLRILMSTDKTEEQKTIELTSLIELPLDFEESQTLEKKMSLFHTAGKQKDDKAQLKEIVETIAAMCNCEEQKQCQLVIGVNDKTNKTCKLQDEIATNYPQMDTLDQFQNTFLVPFIKSYTYDNPMLMSSLKYNWYSYNGDLILIIDINYHGDPVICKGGRLPYRCDSAKMVAEGMDLVNMVKKLTRKVA